MLEVPQLELTLILFFIHNNVSNVISKDLDISSTGLTMPQFRQAYDNLMARLSEAGFLSNYQPPKHQGRKAKVFISPFAPPSES